MDTISENTRLIIQHMRVCADRATGYTASVGIGYNTTRLEECLTRYETGEIAREEFIKEANRHLRSAVNLGRRSVNSFRHLPTGEIELWFSWLV